MPISKIITILKGNQGQFRRFCRVVEDLTMLYLMVAAVWSLCHVVGNLLSWLGVM